MTPAESVAEVMEQLIEHLEHRIAEATKPVPHLHAQLKEQQRQLAYVKGVSK